MLASCLLLDRRFLYPSLSPHPGLKTLPPSLWRKWKQPDSCSLISHHPQSTNLPMFETHSLSHFKIEWKTCLSSHRGPLPLVSRIPPLLRVCPSSYTYSHTSTTPLSWITPTCNDTSSISPIPKKQTKPNQPKRSTLISHLYPTMSCSPNSHLGKISCKCYLQAPTPPLQSSPS